MEAVFETLAGTALSEWMRLSRWGYALVNTVHVLGIALLVGAISALNFRLIGAWRQTPVAVLAPILVPVALVGLCLAFISGTLLFLTDPVDYASVWLFVLKMALIAVGVAHALKVQFSSGLIGLSASRQRIAGILSLMIWLCVLVSGRMIGFVGD